MECELCNVCFSQEQATLKAKQRMLREDWELFKAQRKLIQQKMWNKTARFVVIHVSPRFCLSCFIFTTFPFVIVLFL